MSNHSDEFYKALNYSTSEFDKSIVFIASGALGISMAFIDKIVPLETAINKEWLIGAWGLFGITILLNMITHFISQLANRWAIHNDPNDFPKGKKKKKMEKKYMRGEKHWNYLIRGLNFSMIVALVAGFSLFLYFIYSNILSS